MADHDANLGLQLLRAWRCTERVSVRADVVELLSEGVAGARDRERCEFGRRAGELKDRIILFGAGGLGRKTAEGLRRLGIEPLAFCDNSVSLWGREVCGIPVFEPAEAARQFGESAVFIVTIWASWADRMVDQIASLERLGCRVVIPFPILLWTAPELFLPHIQVDLPSRVHEQSEAAIECVDLWSDSDSAREYLAQLRWRLLCDFHGLGQVSSSMEYFPEDLFAVRDDEAFADVGAFDGDTVASFLAVRGDRFKRLWAFEPDTTNFAKMESRIRELPEAVRDRISLHRKAVGGMDGLVSFASDGTMGSKISEEGSSVQCVRLDSFFEGNEPPTLIKMDVEGAELESLGGSASVIKRFRPKLAVCAYHLQDHLWKVPLSIHRLNPGYELYLRPHGQIWDLVCYARPRS